MPDPPPRDADPAPGGHTDRAPGGPTARLAARIARRWPAVVATPLIGLVTMLVGGDRVPGQRRPRGWPLLVGAVLTVLFALVTTNQVRAEFGATSPLAPLGGLLLALPIVLLVRWPLMAWRLTVLTILAMLPVWHGRDWPVQPFQVILYLAAIVAVGLRHSRAVLAWVWAVTMVLVWLLLYPVNADNAIAATVLSTLLLLAVGAIGSLLSARRQLAVETRRTEAEQQRSAVLTERARIARELHDVVAHHMSLIAVQAETAPYRLPGLPTAADDEFAAIGTAARQALGEMRRMLGVLRAEQPAERTPQPGLAELPALLHQARRAGAEIELRNGGTPRPVPVAVDVSGYRIVQEALSNARRHAPGAPVTVRLEYRPGALAIEVVNAAPDAPPVAGEPGHGLLGMRERATMLGGTLSANPTPDGGFRVAAVLPCDPDDAAPNVSAPDAPGPGDGAGPGTSAADDPDRAGS
ncbi:two-component sensor histidine kinase [Actinocatenispora thailandica]|uniref:histidine kinase n=1 Tax=Actinocatenispora thailandica TaxID=227318 RepID=A0A7R7I062_9ACTN|nr:sensor histidine kinase [Actinocatenispora thailandica]BCJ38256.1 two-component sensor histidine kinase [Actinocatenispora thailandica]